MVMTVMAMRAAGRTGATEGLREILQVWQLPRLRRVSEVVRKLAELPGRSGISFGLRRLGSRIEILADLRGHALILGRVRFLKLLQRAHQLR